MASTLTQFFSSIFSPRPQRKIAIIGLDGSGGMELLRRLCGGAIKEVKDQRSWAIVHTATDYWLRCDFVLAEVGFAAKPAYFHWMATQYCDADGIIWIIDATDTDRLLESKLEMGICRKGGKFGQGLEQPGVRPDAPWLVLMNFKKIPLSTTEAKRQAELVTKDVEDDLDWTFRPVSTITGEGLKEAAEWIYKKAFK